MCVPVIRLRLARLLVASLALGLVVAAAHAQTPVKFSLDGRIEGPTAAFLVGLDHGYFKSEGLDVTIDAAANPAEPFTRVASGGYDMAVGDLNTLIRWRDQNPSVPLKAVFIVQNRPAYAIIGRKSRGVVSPKDLEEKKLAAPAADPASAQWPIFARLNAIDAAKVAVVNAGIPVREPMLAAGEVDAITGMSYGAPINLREKGVPADDITVLLMADYGLDLYGQAIFVHPKFLAEKADAVRAFLRAYTRALKATIKDPMEALTPVLQRNGGSNKDIEFERLLTVLKLHVVTPEVRANGLGDLDVPRFDKAIEQIGLTHQLKGKPKAADLFDPSFLPPGGERGVD